jgi:solute carrier family 25 folate transporter 32
MSGLTASILGISHALIYFPLYEHWKMYFKSKYEPEKDKLSNRYVFLSAIFSKSKLGTASDGLPTLVVSSAIAYPHEVLRARQQDARDLKSSRLRDVISAAIKKEGPIALYSGFMTNLMRILPHYAIVFVLYEQFSYTFSQIID